MSTIKKPFQIIFIFLIGSFALHAEEKTIIIKKKPNLIPVQTNKLDIICTLQPLTKAEAKELFGSNGALHQEPYDIVIDHNDTIKDDADPLSLLLYHILYRRKFTNYFSNLHNRYTPLLVTIINNSDHDITIFKGHKNNEEYLSTKTISFEPKSMILERYKVTGIFKKTTTAITTGIAALLSLYFIKTAYVRKDIMSAFIAGSCAITATLCGTKFITMEERFRAQDDLKSHFALLNNEPSEENGENYITIPAGATFKDIMFINNETHRNALSDLTSPEAQLTLIYELTSSLNS